MTAPVLVDPANFNVTAKPNPTHRAPDLKPLNPNLDVSIAVTTVNTNSFIEVLSRIHKYTPPLKYEVVVVADCSTPEYFEMLQTFLKEGKINKLVTGNKVRGAPAAYNAGMLESQAKYVCLVAADIFVGPNWLTPLLEALKRHPEYGWVTPRWFSTQNIQGPNTSANCGLFTREALLEVGLFDEQFGSADCNSCDDDDLYIRFRLAGYVPHAVANVTVLHLIRATQDTVHAGKVMEHTLAGQKKLVAKWGVSGTMWDQTPTMYIDDYVVKTVWGPKIWVDHSCESEQGIALKQYDPRYLDFYQSCLKNDQIVVDVGANIGLFSLVASLKAKHVYCFEPNPNSRTKLFRNLQLNKTGNVTCFSEALGDENTTKELLVPYGVEGESTLLQDSFSHLEWQNFGRHYKIPVNIVGFDDYWNRISGQKVDMIKIDVEGAEMQVLKGMKQTLTDSVTQLFLETHVKMLRQTDIEISEIFDFLVGCGFTHFKLVKADLTFNILEYRKICHLLENLSGDLYFYKSPNGFEPVKYANRYEWLQINSRGKILDIGSASGHSFRGMHNIVNFDLDLYNIADFVRGAAEYLPFKNKAFSVSTIADVLEHVANPVQTIREAMRVSEKVLLTVPDEISKLEQQEVTDIYNKWSQERLQKSVDQWVRDNKTTQVTDDQKHPHLFSRRFYNEEMLRKDLDEAGYPYKLEKLNYSVPKPDGTPDNLSFFIATIGGE